MTDLVGKRKTTIGVFEMHYFNPQRPKLLLICHFIAWKLLLVLVALLSPGPGYDTSTSIALELPSTNVKQGSQSTDFASTSQWNLILKLTRWDALYFTKVAQRGYMFEQEWMAGFGFTKLLAFLSSYGKSPNQMVLASLVGIFLAHFSHLLSVLVLHDLGLLSLGRFQSSKRSTMALVAAYLHIISPAGMFLSAPYAESLFSLMTFLGFDLYARALLPFGGAGSLEKDLFLMSAGLCFGLATTVRANGLLNGLVLVYEAVISASAIFNQEKGGQRHGIRRLCVVSCAGTLMGCISFFPQYIAYLEYCVPLAKRPWCLRRIPSIYTWIQSEYWGVGFLNYWTFSNLPLFILAMPMLGILCVSGIWVWTNTAPSMTRDSPSIQDMLSEKINVGKERIEHILKSNIDLPFRLAIPQLAIAVLGFTTYHVQIITRLSSAYPVWYWWLSHLIIEDSGNVGASRKNPNLGLVVTRWMIIYAVIQGGLFASFLPPA